jgi:hypothetical protein
MKARRFALSAALVMGIAALTVPAAASAGWQYTFKHFIKTSKASTSSGATLVKRCAPGLAGDWRLISKIYVDTLSPQNPNGSEVEIEVTAKMPITTKFRLVHDVAAEWSARLPKDPAVAELLAEHYERLTQSQEDFYQGMKVRWRPQQKKLDIVHSGLFYDGYEQLAPDEFTTAFKPKPGC